MIVEQLVSKEFSEFWLQYPDPERLSVFLVWTEKVVVDVIGKDKIAREKVKLLRRLWQFDSSFIPRSGHLVLKQKYKHS